jgi:hypothetical protein
MGDITSAIDFLKKIKSQDSVTIKFIKKDNTVRLMKCTLDFKQIEKTSHPKGINLPAILSLIQKNILRVFDLEKQEWRSVPFDRVEYLETPTKERFYYKKSKN